MRHKIQHSAFVPWNKTSQGQNESISDRALTEKFGTSPLARNDPTIEQTSTIQSVMP